MYVYVCILASQLGNWLAFVGWACPFVNWRIQGTDQGSTQFLSGMFVMQEVGLAGS